MLPSSLLHFTNKHKKEDDIEYGYSTYIDTIEDSLRALSILLPGRFEDADLCSQAILAGLNLVSLYHTKFLVKKSMKKNHEAQVTSFNHRFTQLKWPCEAASWALSVISYSEVIVEMVLSRKTSSNHNKWKWIASLEGIKALLRLVLFYGTSKKIILYPTHFIRNVDPVSLDVLEEEKFELLALDPRTGTALSFIATDQQQQQQQSRGSRKWAQFAELLWILRPFVYVCMIMLEQKRKTANELIRLKQDKQEDDEEDESIEKEDEGSWKPWLVSLSIDLLSRTARHMQPMSSLERDESKRRDYLFIYYLFRGPIYLKFTRILLDKFCNATEHRPLISVITAAINDYRPFWEDSYFYTAGS